jgi:hypothetical protein
MSNPSRISAAAGVVRLPWGAGAALLMVLAVVAGCDTSPIAEDAKVGDCLDGGGQGADMARVHVVGCASGHAKYRLTAIQDPGVDCPSQPDGTYLFFGAKYQIYCIAPVAGASSSGYVSEGNSTRSVTASPAASAAPTSAPPTSSGPTPPPSPLPTTQPPSSGPGPITNTFSGLCIDTNGPQGPGVHTQVRDCGNYSGQSWSYDTASNHLVNPPSGLCLDTAGAPATGVNAVLNPCGNYTGQQWQYHASTGQFTNLTSGLCLDTAGPPANDVNLLLNPCGNYTGQGWHM